MKKIYFIATLVILAGLYSYHFLAAEKAERQIDEAIQEQLEQRDDSLSIQYSKIDISPFSANVSFKDLTIISAKHINRSKELTFDLEYTDFLSLYFRGSEKGLQNLAHAKILLVSASYIDRAKFREIKSDSLKIDYYGNVLGGITSLINKTPFTTDQKVEISGSNVTISIPQSPVMRLNAQTLNYSLGIDKEKNNLLTQSRHNLRLDSLNWTPSKSFQDMYGFFIKGFGYPTNAIPFEYAELNIEPADSLDTIRISASLRSNLALLKSDGKLSLKDPILYSSFVETTLTLSDFSKSFSNFLQNVQQLIPGSVSESEKEIIFQLQGSLAEPYISK